jgi:transcriptional regulator GlxA family with amidase domain
MVEAMMRGAIAKPWPLVVLSELAHLSTSQLSRVFVQAYGKTPWACLTMLQIN